MPRSSVFPGVDPRSPEHGARLLAKKLRGKIPFSSEKLGEPTNSYVAWIDLMGAGNMMSYSAHKAANAIARIHLAVHQAKTDHMIALRTLAVNDGLFLISSKKLELLTVLRTAILYLVANFVARPNHPDRFLARSAIAYGPVYFGESIAANLTEAQRKGGAEKAFSQVVLGAPIIQAFLSERSAAAYGVAVHESARTFAPSDERPFRITHWRWWQTDDVGGFSAKTPQPVLPLKDLFVRELLEYFEFLEATLPFHLIGEGKPDEWAKHARRYYLDYARAQSTGLGQAGADGLTVEN